MQNPAAQQLTLFDIDEPERIARRTDPQTSHDAAAEQLPRIGKSQADVLAVIRRSASALTANEAAEIARRSTANNSRMCETYRKRLGELERKGLVRVVGVRACGVTGKRVQMYEAVR